MSNSDRFRQVLTIVAVLLTAFIPAYVAYDLYGRGTVPEKRVELHRYLEVNPLKDLSALGDKVNLSLSIGDKSIDNLVIARAMLINAGTSPILPSEFHENISVSVEKPWRILAVEHDKDSYTVRFKWNKISDTRFEAQPALLNPRDIVFTNVYLTNTQSKQTPTSKEDYAKPNIVWNTRIVNLRGFTETPPNYLDLKLGIDWGILIRLSGWAVPFVIITAMLFQTLLLHLLARAGLLRTIRIPAILFLLGASLLSFAAAESMATYLFPDHLFKMMGIQHSYNAPWIILYWVVLIFLYRKAKLKTTQ